MKLQYLILILIVAACVKKRPVERFQDFDGNRWEKATFLTKKPWLYRVTVVNNGLNSKFGFVGLQSNPRLGYFDFSQTQLRFVEVKENYVDGPNTDKVINAWNITHSDVHRKVVNGRKSNVETENNDIPWYEKRFFKVDWSSAEIKERATFPYGIDESCWTPLSSKLVEGEQEVTAEHIGFVIAVNYLIQERCIESRDYYNNDLTLTIHYKYSFMPEPDVTDYTPYVYTGEDDPLMDKYGYFNATVLSYDELNRAKNIFYMTRWNPNKTHTFYFTKDFPEEYKWIYNDPSVGVFARTNQLFEEYGIPTRFEIKDNDGSKKFGDIRYSFIHFVKEPDFSAPFGYGPSTAHPRTGEIISAHSVIWTNDLKWYVQMIRDTQQREASRIENSSVLAGIRNTLNQEIDEWDASSAFLQEGSLAEIYRFLIPDFTYELPGSAFAGKEVPLKFTSLEKVLNSDAIAITYNQDFQEALKHTQATLKDAGDMYKAREYFNNPALSTRYDFGEHLFAGFSKLDLSDEKKIIDDILYRVAIHEFGHNLNLRHNFYGSVDAGIDRHRNNGNSNKTSHSVMDYISLREEIGQDYDWEIYDKAALLYAYSDGKIDISKDRDAPYLFCTDHHTIFNPLCNRFDSGATPSEIIKNQIDNYDDSYWLRNFRYGRSYWQPSNSYGGTIFNTMFSMKKMIRFYEQAFLESDVRDKLRLHPLRDEAAELGFSQMVRADMLQAVKLVLGFYKSVITQSAFDRPFADRYNQSSGALSQLGIASDKIFAAVFLFGDDAFPLNPNRGFTPASILSVRSSFPELQAFVDESLADVFVEGGDMYAGYSDLIRSLYTFTAAQSYELAGDLSDLMRLRVNCYSLGTFAERFNSSPTALGSQPVEVTEFNPAVVPDFQGEGSIVALRVGEIVLAAGKNLNPYAADVLLANDKSGGRFMASLYQRIVYGRTSLTCE